MNRYLSSVAWFIVEACKVFHSPLSVVGGLLDAIRSWKFSRYWWRIWIGVPSVVLLIAFYGTLFATRFNRQDSQVQSLLVESENRYATKELEAICVAGFDDKVQQLAGEQMEWKPSIKTYAINEKKLRFIELLSKRVLAIENENLPSQYRLALVQRIRGDEHSADAKMRELASMKNANLWNANSWVARQMILDKFRGLPIDLSQLRIFLDRASNAKDIDFGLLNQYSRLLEAYGDNERSVEIAKQAAALKPELNIELARLYSRIGNEEGARETAFAVEDFFGSRLNTLQETEQDRLAIAEARVITKRYDQAATLLEEGLAKHPEYKRWQRGLSEAKRFLYLQSVRQHGSVYNADLSILEEAAAADSTNPRISEEIAKLLRLKLVPTKRLFEALKIQIDNGSTTADAHMLLAEGYLVRGNTNEAIKHWELALIRNPNYHVAANNLAVSLARANPENIDRAIKLLENAIANSPPNPELFDSLGEVLMKANRPAEAINKFEMAIRCDDRRIDTRKKLLEAYRLLGFHDFAESEEQLIASLERNAPKRPPANTPAPNPQK